MLVDACVELSSDGAPSHCSVLCDGKVNPPGNALTANAQSPATKAPAAIPPISHGACPLPFFSFFSLFPCWSCLSP